MLKRHYFLTAEGPDIATAISNIDEQIDYFKHRDEPLVWKIHDIVFLTEQRLKTATLVQPDIQPGQRQMQVETVIKIVAVMQRSDIDLYDLRIVGTQRLITDLNLTLQRVEQQLKTMFNENAIRPDTEMPGLVD